jgi:hypothetical protein
LRHSSPSPKEAEPHTRPPERAAVLVSGEEAFPPYGAKALPTAAARVLATVQPS